MSPGSDVVKAGLLLRIQDIRLPNIVAIITKHAMFDVKNNNGLEYRQIIKPFCNWKRLLR